MFSHLFHFLASVVVPLVMLTVMVALIVKPKGFPKVFLRLARTLRTQRSPARIHLTATANIPWQNAAQMQTNQEECGKLGFDKVGIFSILEMPGAHLNAMVKPAESSYCVIYEHPRVGMWLDFVTLYADDTGLTVSNSPRGGELDTRPGQEKIRVKGGDLNDLYSLLVQHREEKQLRQITGSVEEFISIFEHAYGEEMDWRNSRGGPTADEIRRVASASRKPVNDAIVKMAQAISHKQAWEGLNCALEEGLREKYHYSDSDWQQLRPRVLFIYDQLSPEVLPDLVRAHVHGTRVEKPLTAGISARDLFCSLNQSLPANQRFEQLTVLSKPVMADVYLAPAAKSSAVHGI